MEKHQHPFDDFLKETLKGHRLVPREEARKAFLDEASTIDHARRGWFRWYYLPLLVAVISGIVVLFSYFGNENEVPAVAVRNETPVIEPTTPSSLNDKPSAVTNTEIATLPADSYTENQIHKTKDPNTGTQAAGNPSSSIFSKALAEKEPALPAPSEPADIQAPVSSSISEQTEDKTDSNSASQKPASADISAGTANQVREPEPVQTSGTDAATEKDTIASIPPAYEPKNPEPLEVMPETAFAASVYYLPEYMFNTVEGGKFVNNFGFDFTFYRGRTSIRTGAGISISQGLTEKAVEYNEFLGTYNKLDSISFTFNESAGDFYPTIHTSSENVWDSLPLYDSTEIIKRYTYLQIPLILGFDFWQKNRLTVGVRIGTIMSVMLKSKQLTGAYEAGANQVVGISKLSPDQVSMNWQAVGGINGSLMLTRRLYLEIEPQAKYYYQSIYEKSGYDKKPWSLGVKLAVSYKF
jgi:hypothetical protein